MRRSLFAAAVLFACSIAQAEPVPPPPSVSIGIGFRFVPGQMESPTVPLYLAQGGRLILVGADPLGSHAITSYLTDQLERPLFDSDQAAAGQVVEVIGVTSLQPGDYPFFCRNHFGMDGLLTVQP